LELHRQEKFLYICDILHMWEWDVRVLDIQEGSQQTVRQEATDAVDAAGRPSFATDADQGPQQRARGDVPPMAPAVPSRLTPDFLALSAQIQDVSLDNSALGDTPVLNQTPIGMLFTILFARGVSQKHDSARL
jgi:hypothetical protein